MINFRYHVTTIVAIFLSLGFGLLVGLSLADSEVVRDEQATLIRGIEENLQSLRTNNKNLQHELKAMETVLHHYESVYERANHSGFVHPLHDLRVALFVEASQEIVAHDIQASLQQIGINSQSIVWQPLPLAEAILTNDEQEAERIMRGIADLLQGHEVASALRPLIASGAIRFQSVEAPIHDVVLVTTEVSPLIRTIVDYINPHEQAGILTLAADTGSVDEAEQLGWSVVPFIHNAAGRFHLAVLLSERHQAASEEIQRDEA